MFSNLVRETKTVTVSEAVFVLKKHPKKLKDWLLMRLVDTATWDPNAQGGKGGFVNAKPMARPFTQIEEEDLERVFLGLESWSLRNDAGDPVPLNRESVRALYEGFPGVFSALLEMVTEFNTPLTKTEGEPLAELSKT